MKMKLLTRTIIYYSLLSIPLLTIAGVAFYFIISSSVNESMDESLLNTMNQLDKYINTKTDNHDYSSADGDTFLHFEKGIADEKIIFRDSAIFDSVENEYLPYRILSTQIPSRDGRYVVYIRKASIETEDLINGIIISVIVVFIVLFIGLVVLNWWINQKLWRPFYKTLSLLGRYRIGQDNTQIDIPQSSISEFNALRHSLNDMLIHAHHDYQKQKEFTENASHEMQTPLAVMQNNIDLLIQSSNLGEQEMQLISSILSSQKKLSRLNKSLLLLSKIDNGQFTEVEEVSFIDLLKNTLPLFEAEIKAKKIVVNKTYHQDLVYHMNRGLCEILLINLIQNAVRHNVAGGTIDIALNSEELRIINTGDAIREPEKVFERFSQSHNHSDSVGLGLAIVHQITMSSGLHIEYKRLEEKHCFIVSIKEIIK